MTNYDKVCIGILVPYWNDIKNLHTLSCRMQHLFIRALAPARCCHDETLIYLKKMFSKNQGCVSLGGSGLRFVIQDHTDHGVSKERSFRVPSFERVRIRIIMWSKITKITVHERNGVEEFQEVPYFKTWVCTWLARLTTRAFSAHNFSN